MRIPAEAAPCAVLYRPTDPVYAESIRQFQGCPTIATTRGGRIYLGWYSGGIREPHMDNYNLIVYSDDRGKTWSPHLLVIPSSRENWVHALDVQLWTDPVGALHVYWVQNNTHPEGEPGEGYTIDGWVFGDYRHTCWEIVCHDPDAADPVFTAPRLLDTGFLRCKPLVLSSGRQLNFNYDQLTEYYGYSISDDGGKTFARRYGAKKIETPFDEAMAYERTNGDVRMFARTAVGELAESTSHDGGLTWDEAKLSGIDSPNTRLCVRRTPSGRLLLVNNDHRTARCRMTAYLSEDDGDTWTRRLIDPRSDLSYPDFDFIGERIYLTYDRERTGAMEILLTSFTEEDLLNPDFVFDLQIVSKPRPEA